MVYGIMHVGGSTHEKAVGKARAGRARLKAAAIACAAALLMAGVATAAAYLTNSETLVNRFTLAQPEAYAVYSETDGSLTFYDDNLKPEQGKNDPHLGHEDNKVTKVYTGFEDVAYGYDAETETETLPEWIEDSVGALVTSVSFEGSVKPMSMYGWFSGMRNLVSVELNGNLDASEVAVFSGTFADCPALTSLDLGGLDTGAGEYFYSMFEDCSGLTSLKLGPSFTCASGMNFDYMFRNCSSLTSLDLSGLDTGAGEHFIRMFDGCTNLASLTLGEKFTCVEGREFGYMFNNCSSLEFLNLSSVDTSFGEDLGDMFAGMASLKEIELGENFKFDGMGGILDVFKASLPAQTDPPIAGADGLWYKIARDESGNLSYVSETGIAGDAVPNGAGTWYAIAPQELTAALYSDGDLVFQMGKSSLKEKADDGVTILMLADGVTPAVWTGFEDDVYTKAGQVPWNAQAAKVTRVTFDAPVKPKSSMAFWFAGMSNCAIIDFAGLLDASSVTNYASTFLNCSNLTSIDTAPLKAAKSTTFNATFKGCARLAMLDMVGFDTSNSTSFNNTFDGCKALATLDVSGFSTEKSYGFAGMFRNCSALAELEVGGFVTNSCEDFSYMFAGCSGLSVINVSEFNTAKGKNFDGMFSGCSGLSTVDLSNFNTSRGLNFYGMFQNCSGLIELDVSGFETPVGVRFDFMFRGCTQIEMLDLTRFDTTRATPTSGNNNAESGMVDMFTDMPSLSVVMLGEKFSFIGNGECVDANAAILPDGLWEAASNGALYEPADVPSLKHDTYRLFGTPYAAVYYSRVLDAHFLAFGRGEPPDPMSASDFAPAFAGVSADDCDLEEKWTDIESASFVRQWDEDEYGDILAVKAFAKISPKNCVSWFQGMSRLGSCDMSLVDMSKCSDFSSMFELCPVLSLDCSAWNVQETALHSDFNLSSPDVRPPSAWVDLSAANLGLKAVDADSKSLIDLAFLNADGEVAVVMGEGSLAGDSVIAVEQQSDFGSNINGTVTDTQTTFETPTVAVLFSAADDGDGSLVFYDREDAPTVGNVFDGQTVSAVYTDFANRDFSAAAGSYEAGYANPMPWANRISEITSVRFADEVAPASCAFWFRDAVNLIKADVSGLDGSACKSYRQMFAACPSLRSVANLGDLDTSAATSFAGMFWQCSRLADADVSGFTVGNGADFNSMFDGCTQLSVDCSKWGVDEEARNDDFATNTEAVQAPEAWDDREIGVVADAAVGGQSDGEAPACADGWSDPLPSRICVTSEFGYRDFDASFHKGIDLAANSGVGIHAAAAGTVAFAGWYGGGGNTVIIDHGNGYVTYYMHQSELALNVGDKVAAGDLVGFVGSTGDSTGPHLHFQVELSGTPVNPREILPFE